MDLVAEAVEPGGEAAEVRPPVAERAAVGGEGDDRELEAVAQDPQGLVQRVLGAAAGEEARQHQERRPVVGAWVGQGKDRCRPYTVETRTDQQGRYRFGNGRPGRLTLTVAATGHAPELREVLVTKGMKPVDFQLAPGKTIRLRVVDTAGKRLACQ